MVESRFLEETSRGDAEHRDGDKGRLANSPLRGKSILCFGSLDWETRGRIWYKRILPMDIMPTALLYVPTTRSIVVACRGSINSSNDNTSCDGKAVLVGTRRANNTTQDRQVSVVASSLRVFSADTLEERPGDAVYLRPGIRITGLSRLGVEPVTKLSLRTSPGSDYSARRTKNTLRDTGAAAGGIGVGLETTIGAAAAVGGDAIAVACCFHAGDGEESLNMSNKGKRRPTMQKQAAGGSTMTNSTLSTATTTVVAAFEVVAWGNGHGEQIHERCGARCRGRHDR